MLLYKIQSSTAIILERYSFAESHQRRSEPQYFTSCFGQGFQLHHRPVFSAQQGERQERTIARNQCFYSRPNNFRGLLPMTLEIVARPSVFVRTRTRRI